MGRNAFLGKASHIYWAQFAGKLVFELEFHFCVFWTLISASSGWWEGTETVAVISTMQTNLKYSSCAQAEFHVYILWMFIFAPVGTQERN